MKTPEPNHPRRDGLASPLRTIALVTLILVGSAALLLEAASRDSVTIDEFAHLPHELYNLHARRLTYPSLQGLLCALPAWWSGARSDGAGLGPEPNHWALGYDFMSRYADQYHTLFIHSRLPAVMLTLVLETILLVAGWRAFGPSAGVTAAALCAFCPNILTHGHLITTDLGHTLFFLLAVLAYDRALRQPSVVSWVLAGGTLGLAQLTKFASLNLYPILAVITLVAGWSGHRPLRAWLTFIVCVTLSILVLNACYGFEGSGAALATYPLESAFLRSLAAGPLGHVPVPLPFDFLHPYDQQMRVAGGQAPVFFHGELSHTGWWYYYVAAFVLKTPLPLLILFALGTVTWVLTGRWRADPLGSATLFLPPLLYMTLYSVLTDVNVGLRYVLPVYPFVFLIAASLWATPWAARRAGCALLWLLVLGQVGTALRTRPYYLSYFNVLAGGSENGYRWLIDSNVDWGQELLRLQQYLAAQGIAKVRFAYFGRVDPAVYGIDYEMIPAEITPGVYVISASYLMGRPYYLYDHGRLFRVPPNRFAGFQRYRPSAVIGYSLFVFDLREGLPEPGAAAQGGDGGRERAAQSVTATPSIG